MTEFIKVCEGKGTEKILDILDDLMWSLKEILPWKYEEVIEAIKEL